MFDFAICLVEPVGLSLYLASPAHAQGSPLCDGPSSLLRNLLDNSWNLARGLWWSGRTLQEGTELLTFFFGVGRVPALVGWLTEEEVRYKDLVLVVFVIGMSKDVGALSAVINWNEESGGRIQT